MRSLGAWLRRLAAVFGGDQLDRDLENELESHLHQQVGIQVRLKADTTD